MANAGTSAGAAGDSTTPGKNEEDDVRIGVLGPMIGNRNGELLNLGGPKQLCVLAVLIAESPRIVTADEIALAVYGDDAPERGRRRVQTYVSILRSLLGEVIVRRGEGWVFLSDQASVDAIDFEAMIARAGELRPAGASELLSEALAMWRGVPFSEVDSYGRLDAEIDRLEELRMLAIEQRIDADLDQGKAPDLVPELTALIAEHPYRESLRSRHMLALYRSGRQKEALASFESLRVLLLEELGVDPTPELRELEARILRQDDRLKEPDGEPLRGYRLLKEVGGGAFSVVWRGVQPTIDRPVAIKQIRGELADRPAFIRSFESEARTIARVEHPHIVPLIDFWRDPKGAYLVMRWLGGGTLEESLTGGAWSVERTVKMVRQIGDALTHAHTSGVVHRDVTTSNIMLDEHGNAFLGDFGIALGALDPSTDGITSPDSLPYSAPEQLRNEPLDPRADIFSFAVVIYECLAGFRPFGENNTDAELVRRQLSEPLPPLIEARSDVADHISAAITKATSKSPGERFDSVLDFVEALVGTETTETSTAAIDPSEVTNPYKGLRTFEEPDADDFFGRVRLVDELIDALAGEGLGSRCVTVVGPSGSGKSSVVRAGLLPALRNGQVNGSDEWYLTTMVPGARPFEALENALLRVATDPPPTLLHQLKEQPNGVSAGVRACLPKGEGVILVVIDQLEELFGAAPPERAHAFLASIAAAVSNPESALRVVATLRADYYDRPLSHPTFADVLKAGAVDVTPFAADELEAAVSQPAQRQGVDFEPGLVARIASDAHGQPGSLPLLQHALADLFERRDGTAMTVESYEDSGALAGALAARADELYLQGSEEERTTTRQVFGRLVDPSALTTPATTLRRRALRRDLGDDSTTAAVIDRFSAARLLTFDRDPTTREQTVEVAHEALLREWPRLTGWLEDDKALLLSVDHLGRSADAWQDGGRVSTDLYRGGRLETGREVTTSAPERLRAIDREFIDSSLAEAQTKRVAEAKRLRRLKRLVTGVAAALVIALVAGAIALQQRGRASEQATEASARGIAAQASAIASRNLDGALLLAANGAAQAPGPETQAGVINALDAAAGLVSSGPYPGPGAVESVAFASDGLAASFHSGDNTIRFFDVTTGEAAGSAISVDWDGTPQFLTTSIDGSTVAARQLDGFAVWDRESGELLASGIASGRNTVSAAVSPLGTYLTIFDFAVRTYEVYSIEEDRLLGQLPLDGVEGFPIISEDETTLHLGASGRNENEPQLYATFSLPDLTLVADPAPFDTLINTAVPNGDGSVIAVSPFANPTLTLVDPATLESLSPTTTLDGGRLTSIDWNPSSTHLFVATVDGEVVVFSADGVVEGRFVGRAEIPAGVGWIDDDQVGVVYGDTMMTFDLAARPPLAQPAGGPAPEGPPTGFADARRDGTFVVNRVSNIQVVDPDGESSEFPLSQQISEGCLPIRVQPDGELAVLWCLLPLPDGGQSSAYAVVNIEQGVVVHEPIALRPGVGFLDTAISPDGEVVAIVGQDEVNRTSLVQLVDASTGEVLIERDDLDRFIVADAEWTPDEQHLLIAGQDGELKFLDDTSLELEASVVLTGEEFAATDISFDAAGQTAIVATEAGEVWRVDLETQTTVGEPFVGAAAQFQEASISPDGSHIAAAGRDGLIRVWDVESGVVIGAPFDGGADQVRFIDDDTILTTRFFGQPLLWDLSIENLINTACSLAGRGLSNEELAQFGADLDGDVCTS